MRLLAIETSCDETALAILEARGDLDNAEITVRANALNSQVDVHRPYGGVFPTLAKREHGKNLVPMLQNVLIDAGMYEEIQRPLAPARVLELKKLFEREPELFAHTVQFASAVEKPDVEALAVTHGPGLEPALWVGINFARALGMLWDVPVIPVNHMEGHFLSAFVYRENGTLAARMGAQHFPALALLVSGGHSELVYADTLFSYDILGETRDDAAGEAFDKVARLLGLPYPGGPEISRLAAAARDSGEELDEPFPRPMLQDDSLDFSFSGLKTAVRYRVAELGEPDDEQKQKIARAFEDAVVDVLVAKTRRALEAKNSKTFILAGGVAANRHLRAELTALVEEHFPETDLCIPLPELATDNAIMIGVAGALRALAGSPLEPIESVSAAGHVRLGNPAHSR